MQSHRYDGKPTWYILGSRPWGKIRKHGVSKHISTRKEQYITTNPENVSFDYVFLLSEEDLRNKNISLYTLDNDYFPRWLRKRGLSHIHYGGGGGTEFYECDDHYRIVLDFLDSMEIRVIDTTDNDDEFPTIEHMQSRDIYEIHSSMEDNPRTTTDTESTLDERVMVEYSPKELKTIDIQRRRLDIDIEAKEDNGENVTYDNQRRCAKEIDLKFQNKQVIATMVIAKTQSGKTGTMIEFLRQYICESKTPIPIDNIYIITGLSSTEWKEQTLTRFPDCLSSRIFHRNNLLDREFISQLLDKDNVLLIMDEVQIAAREKQTIYNMFLRSALYDKDRLLRQDIKILEFTATPDGTIYGVQDWGSHGAVIKMDPARGYVGCDDLLIQKRVREWKDLLCYNAMTGAIDVEKAVRHIGEIKDVIDTYSRPLYHIIRTGGAAKSDDAVSNFKLVFPSMKYKMYHSNSEIGDINKELLDIPPEKHTFIFIKERLRCAKTLSKKHLGVVYERFATEPNDTVIIQGLLGRLTGYDDTGQTICFTNCDSIYRYKKLYESSFQDRSIQWISNTTTKKNGNTGSAGTYHDKKHFGEDTDSLTSEEDDGPEIKVFNTIQEVKDFCRANAHIVNGYMPNNRKRYDDGFYRASVGTKQSRIYHIDEVKDKCKWNLGSGTKARVYPCYTDITDNTTLRWLLIYYDTSNPLN